MFRIGRTSAANMKVINELFVFIVKVSKCVDSKIHYDQIVPLTANLSITK